MNKIVFLSFLSLFLVACGPVVNVEKEEVESDISEENSTEEEVVDADIESAAEVILSTPEEGSTSASPLEVAGQALGSWFFEGSLPMELRDEDGVVIASGRVFAIGDWMTSEMVEFEGSLTFSWSDEESSKAVELVLMKDNPSGLPENDDAYSISVQLIK